LTPRPGVRPLRARAGPPRPRRSLAPPSTAPTRCRIRPIASLSPRDLEAQRFASPSLGRTQGPHPFLSGTPCATKPDDQARRAPALGCAPLPRPGGAHKACTRPAAQGRARTTTRRRAVPGCLCVRVTCEQPPHSPSPAPSGESRRSDKGTVASRALFPAPPGNQARVVRRLGVLAAVRVDPAAGRHRSGS
jgi:hypothetical protein